ncbi:MAG: type II toxin-antitoxin system Phd/YefM family antitoxin [Verrucomicrobiales bacterium]|nr:type II toxin-antitoxin system Phd/YefM family antitoxin [Verrucomicrobiales bacterium]
MIKLPASEAKLHFGALIDKVQREPITIERQGRPVAVVLSYDSYLEQEKNGMSDSDRRKALEFLDRWGKRPVVEDVEEKMQGDVKAQAIWGKYVQGT